jgi:hypothetical protein
MPAPKRGSAALGPLGGYWRVVIAAVLLVGAFAFSGASGRAELGPVRAAFTLAFMGFGPGLAIMGILRLDDPVLDISIALALSLSLDTILATAMTLLHQWKPSRGLAIIAAVTVVAGLVQINQVRKVKQRTHTAAQAVEAQ